MLGMALSLVAGGCSSPYKKFKEKPQVELRSIDIREPGLTAATFVADLAVTNPNPVSVELDQLNYTLNLNGKDMASGMLDKNLKLPANETATIQVPIRFHYTDIFATLRNLVESRATDYVFKGTMKAGPYELPFKYDGKLEIPKGKEKTESTNG